jgi:hypothetical protein
MSRSTISTFRLFELFPNEEAARKYIENRLWKDGIRCPKCKLIGNTAVRGAWGSNVVHGLSTQSTVCVLLGARRKVESVCTTLKVANV